MIRIEPLGTRIILPAFVVGYEIFGESDCLIELLENTPPWLLVLDQQAGGLAMSYPSVIGCVLRFTDNADKCLSDVEDVVTGFLSMAEDPNIKLLKRDYPILEDLVNTWGENYHYRQIHQLQNFVGTFFNIPPLDNGLEAFIRIKKCDPLTYFQGWKLLSATPKCKPDYQKQRRNDLLIDEVTLDSVTLTTSERFGKETVSKLMDIGQELRLNRHELSTQLTPDTFLLWENSD